MSGFEPMGRGEGGAECLCLCQSRGMVRSMWRSRGLGRGRLDRDMHPLALHCAGGGKAGTPESSVPAEAARGQEGCEKGQLIRVKRWLALMAARTAKCRAHCNKQSSITAPCEVVRLVPLLVCVMRAPTLRILKPACEDPLLP